ncbi:MAG: hypothetical protein AAGB46_01115 [Verrucomicrobiota bacterium]
MRTEDSWKGGEVAKEMESVVERKVSVRNAGAEAWRSYGRGQAEVIGWRAFSLSLMNTPDAALIERVEA